MSPQVAFNVDFMLTPNPGGTLPPGKVSLKARARRFVPAKSSSQPMARSPLPPPSCKKNPGVWFWPWTLTPSSFRSDNSPAYAWGYSRSTETQGLGAPGGAMTVSAS